MDGVTQESMKETKQRGSLGSRIRSILPAVYSYLSFAFVRPLIDKAHKDELNERSATEISFDPPSIKDLAAQFEAIYQRLKVFYGTEKAQTKNLVIRTIAIQYLPIFLFHVLWVTLETAIRLAAPLFLRQFLLWIEDYNDDKAEYYGGWFWGLLLVSCGLGFMLIHHRYVWQGAIIGYRAKYSLISLVHAKLLRLSSSKIAKLTSGHIVNLISNDIKRFEMTFILWLYVIVGPLETLAVLFMVSSVLGFLPALGGVGCILLMIPLQSFFAGYITKFRDQTAVITDKRVGSMEELITGSLAVKMLVWEDPLMDKVNTIREAEDKLLKRTNYIKANSMALYSYIQIVMMCVIMILLRSAGEEFNVPDVFFAISLLALPRLTMTLFFAVSVQQLSELLVSTRRLDQFFKIPEPTPLKHEFDDESSTRGNVSIIDGCYGWYNDNNKSPGKDKQTQSKHQILDKYNKSENEERYKKATMIETLSDIELHIQPGELIGIVGRVGSGKSSILTALLNDMEILSQNSSFQISGTIAYSAQVPFIIAATIRENIVFGRPFDEILYNNVVSSCALNIDIENLPLGDATVLGERGINLSGGQKARVALARSAYSKADINLLDDPLSAVDARVGRTLFEKCIGGDNAIMKNSTRVFVTHQKQFLPFCDRIILMDNGRIERVGRWDQLENHPLLKIEKQVESEQHLTVNVSSDVQNNTQESKDTYSEVRVVNDNEQGGSEMVDGRKEDNNNKQMVIAEGKEHGKVKKRVYWDYLHHIGVLPMLLSLAMLTLAKVLYFGAEWWVARWASAEEDEQSDQKWSWVLISLTIAVAFTSSIGVFSIFHLLIHGSTQLHKVMVKCVLHAPLRFFHTNPTGRILNRFSKDLGMQDDELPILTADILIMVNQLIGTLVLILIALPFTLPLVILIAYLFSRIQKRYTVPSREIKRYDGLTRSPFYAMFSLNMKGVSTIRAFGREKDFHKSMLDSLDLNSSWWLSFLATSRWFGFRLDGISLCITFSAIVAAILASKIVSEEILALALTNALGLSGTLQWCMRQIAELENTMTAVERNLEYTRLEQEPSKVKEGGGETPDNWPTDGWIEFNSVTASYRPELEPVLKDISFKIPGGCSVGIVGRTGSGKSSLLLTLFRLIDVDGGFIFIDDVDTSTIGIDVLRKQIAVIPQDPVLFGGTFRSNLDPWHKFSDVRLWGVLQEVHLDSAVHAFGGLDAPISESGNNLSVGQRQLLCLARALLGESRILALDEATANVDHVTDAQIQASLRAVISQKEKTLLIIAHRINTILDCDLLLVLENGKKVEFGSPAELLGKQEGRFKGMVAAVQKASNASLD